MPERNRVMWRGIRPSDPEEILTRLEPPYGCDYDFGYNTVNNGSVNVYVTPASKVFYLTDIVLTAYCTGGGIAYMWIRDPGGTEVTRFVYTYIVANQPFVWEKSFAIAIPMPYAYKLSINSNIASLYLHCHCNGYTRSV